jgi:hypothetical protein
MRSVRRRGTNLVDKITERRATLNFSLRVKVEARVPDGQDVIKHANARLQDHDNLLGRAFRVKRPIGECSSTRRPAEQTTTDQGRGLHETAPRGAVPVPRPNTHEEQSRC